MSLSKRTLAMTLAMTPGFGGRTVSRVLARNELNGHQPEEFLALSDESWREEYGLKPKQCEALRFVQTDGLADALKLEERLTRLGVTLATTIDAHYPDLVEQMDPDPPGVLFLYGNLGLLKGRTFCALSSRKAKPADMEQLEQLAEEGVLAGETLVSGHDTPEYQRTAVVPLRWGSPRILCLDRGLFRVLGENLTDEAFRAARLWRFQFDPTTDLVVSPFRPESTFIGANNKVRDRLVASLSRRLDFVNINEGGNMESLVRMALRAGRPVRVSDRIIGYRALVEAGATAI